MHATFSDWWNLGQACDAYDDKNVRGVAYTINAYRHLDDKSVYRTSGFEKIQVSDKPVFRPLGIRQRIQQLVTETSAFFAWANWCKVIDVDQRPSPLQKHCFVESNKHVSIEPVIVRALRARSYQEICARC